MSERRGVIRLTDSIPERGEETPEELRQAQVALAGGPSPPSTGVRPLVISRLVPVLSSNRCSPWSWPPEELELIPPEPRGEISYTPHSRFSHAVGVLNGDRPRSKALTGGAHPTRRPDSASKKQARPRIPPGRALEKRQEAVRRAAPPRATRRPHAPIGRFLPFAGRGDWCYLFAVRNIANEAGRVARFPWFFCEA